MFFCLVGATLEVFILCATMGSMNKCIWRIIQSCLCNTTWWYTAVSQLNFSVHHAIQFVAQCYFIFIVIVYIFQAEVDDAYPVDIFISQFPHSVPCLHVMSNRPSSFTPSRFEAANSHNVFLRDT